MADLCNEPHPSEPDILCDKALPCLGYHENIAARLTWDGIPLPEQSTAARKKERAEQIASDAKPTKAVGPPVAARNTEIPTQKPYAGSSGWSGSETSQARADHADTSGQTTNRQRTVYAMIEEAAESGVIWREVADRTGWHHGTVSGALSVLHKGGLVARLSDTRNGCKIYVAPEYVGSRSVEAQGRRASSDR